MNFVETNIYSYGTWRNVFTIYWRLQAIYRIRCFCRNYIHIYYCILCKQNFKVLIIWKD